VTELVTGVDLVQWQLRVAANEPLAFTQEDVRTNGHAIECRITSEDPRKGFLPSTGRIGQLDLPSGPGVRWDGGIAVGYEVSLYYDPMLAKLIVHAADRASAIDRMRRALAELRVVGIDTSTPFHERVMQEPDFQAGNLDIGYLESHADLLAEPPDEEAVLAATLAAALVEDEERRRRAITRIGTDGARPSAWRTVGWRV
jgi:acetyl-CoA carboxylase biotin carboxylase subunit